MTTSYGLEDKFFQCRFFSQNSMNTVAWTDIWWTFIALINTIMF